LLKQEKSKMTTTEKSKYGRWKKGESGNPGGRKPGTGQVAKLRNSIATHVPEIISQMVNKAKDGDVQAARLLLERVVPPLKSMEQSVSLMFPENATLPEQGQIILQSVADGTLTPDQGHALLSGLGSQARLIEITELEERITALENKDES
jgi:polyhydroxyalkanoate synthesis regulator phasin